MADERETLRIEIQNLTRAQAIAIEDMLATWVQLGSWGSSRWTNFFADGDGNFRPRITVNDRKPEHTEFLTDQQRWPNGFNSSQVIQYQVDFDWIAWRLRELAHAQRNGEDDQPR